MKSIAFDIEIPAQVQEQRKRFGYREKIKEGFFRSMRDIDIMIQALAIATGYEKEFLDNMMDEQFEVAGSYSEAWENVRDISLEFDW